MPGTAELIAQATRITSDLVVLAVAWHVVLPLLWRRASPWTLALPAASVAIVAWAYHNPFNALSFAALAAMLATSRPRQRSRPDGGLVVAGGALVVFGAFYPHFVAGPLYRVLWAAPVGLLPCPTLAVIAGLALASGALGSRRSVAALAMWTAFYAVYGIFVLGVVLDLGLALAAVALAVTAGASPRTPAPWRRLS